MTAAARQSSGFRRPAFDSQAAFTGAMQALARPGLIQTLDVTVDAPATLHPATAALVLALADPDAPVWLDTTLSQDPAAAAYLRFHAGCKIVPAPAQAAFALIGDAAAMPCFGAFAQGSLEYPDRSATLLIQMRAFTQGQRCVVTGPGVDGEVAFVVDGLPDDMVARFATNRALFPCGVDVLLVSGAAVLGLPRSAQLREG